MNDKWRRIFAASSGHNYDEEQAKTRLLNAQADAKTESFSDVIKQINDAFGGNNIAPQNSGDLVSSVSGVLPQTESSPIQQNPNGISRLNAIRMAAKAKYNIDIPKTEQELQLERNNKLGDEVAKKELISASTALPKLEQALQSINQLESLYYQGATPDENPILARATGMPDAIKARSGFNPKLNSYLNNRKAFAGLIAKGGFGEAGMLTNQDIERVVAALPSAGSTKEESEIGFREIKTLLQSARDRFERRKKSYLSGGNGLETEMPNPGGGGYKAGDTKIINGSTYIRNEGGQWLPQS